MLRNMLLVAVVMGNFAKQQAAVAATLVAYSRE